MTVTIDVEQMRKDTGVNPIDLNASYLDQSGLLAHYGVLLARAESQAARVKQQLEARIASAIKAMRDADIAAKQKTVEARYEKDVLLDPSVQQLQRLKIQVDEIATIAKMAVESMKHRRDMLIQLGATERKEMEGELRLKAASGREMYDRMVARSASDPTTQN